MITITACARKSHTAALQVAASPTSRVVLYEFGNIDIVCTRASNIGTSKSTHTDALLHTRFLSDLWHGKGAPKISEKLLDTKNKGKNSSCC